MKMIDLRMPIEAHWRWPIRQEFLVSHAKGDHFQATILTVSMHAFTHIDTPLHVVPEKITIDQVGIDQLAGPAAIFHLKNIGPNQPITKEMLKTSAPPIHPGDILLLKTNWDLQRNWRTKEFWTEAPYVDEGAATWLAGQNIKAVGFDFPQDYHIRDIPGRHPSLENLPTHNLILRRGIYLIEYLCNLHQITTNRVELFAFPLKIVGAEGAPARVVAVVK